MYRDHFRRMLGQLKRALGIKQRLTIEEFYRLLQLAEAIVDYGRMFQTYHGHSAPYVIVEIEDLVTRFRETSQTMKDALLLLRDMGFAEPVDPPGCWKLRLAGALLKFREDAYPATRGTRAGDADQGDDLGAA